MTIGIIGYGKMGKDIFSLISDKMPENKFIVLCRNGIEENTSSVMKNLGKSLKRKKITEEQFEKRKNSFLFTDKIENFRECDIIIESVTEDIDVKIRLFNDISKVVSDKCLLLTNTSSLDISEIFRTIPDIERCFGLHFFYPVKLTGFVEINRLQENSEENIEKAIDFIEAMGKKAVVFSNSYHMYLNQILAGGVCHAIYLCEYFNNSVSEMTKALENTFSLAGPFDVLDSIGLGLMAGNSDSFKNERMSKLLQFGFGKMHNWIAKGCSGDTMKFLEFIKEYESPTGNICENAELYMIAFILNETVNAVSEYEGDKAVCLEAVADIMGLAENMSFYLEKYGFEKIFSVLDNLYEKTGFEAYKHQDIAIWKKILEV